MEAFEKYDKLKPMNHIPYGPITIYAFGMGFRILSIQIALLANILWAVTGGVEGHLIRSVSAILAHLMFSPAII